MSNEIEIIYVASPFRPIYKKSKILFWGLLINNIKYNRLLKRNIKYAIKCVKWCVNESYSPYAPHLVLPLVLDEEKEKERNKGMRLSSSFIKRCDALIMFTDYGKSEGMIAEEKTARENNIEVIEIKIL